MSDQEFNPADKFTDLKGQLYLEVKWRIVWLRDDAPESQIRTQHVILDDQLAVFKATVTRIVDGQVKGIGEGYGSEQPKDFPDYIEKSETKAIGRALAALGYGTAAAFEEDPSRIADAPVRGPAPPAERTTPRDPAPRREPESRSLGQRPPIGPGVASEKQVKYLFALAGEHNPDKDITAENFLRGQVMARFGVAHLHEMSKQQASSMVDYLKNQDFIDAVMPPPNGRVDPVEAVQEGLAAMPEEPSHLRDAPIYN